MADSADSTREVTYLILEYVGIFLLLLVALQCVYRSTSYTLLILCIVTILNSINETALLIHYNYDLSDAFGSVGCTITAAFEHFLPLSLVFLSACMSFNVWFLIVWKAQYTERELLPWFCLFSFGVPAVNTAIAFILLRNKPYFSAYPRHYYCEFRHTGVILGTYSIPMFTATVIGVTLMMTTVVVLLLQYRKIRRTINSGSLFHANPFIGLSQCVRMVIFSFAFGTIVMMATLQIFVEGLDVEVPDISSESLDVSSDYSGSLIGYFIFIIFGTTKDSLRTLSNIFCWCKRKKSSFPEPLSGEEGLPEQDEQECSYLESRPSGPRRISSMLRELEKNNTSKAIDGV